MDQFKPRPANSSPLTPLSFLDRAATAYSDFPSIIYNDKTYTWLETKQRCLALASSLASLGIKRHDVVSVVAPNVPAMYELHFAVPMSGAVLNTINTRLDARMMHVILHHCESKVVFVDYATRFTALEAISLYPLDSEVKPPRVVFIIEDNEEVNDKELLGAADYEEMIKVGDSEFKWVRPESEWDPMVLNYTSGTTSAPKGVVHSHRGLYVMALSSLIDWSVRDQSVYIWTLPMFHGNGWCYTWGMAAVGGTNICIRKVHAPTIYSLIEKYDATHLCGAPVVLSMLINAAEAKSVSHPVHIMIAGAPPQASVLIGAESLGFIVSHGYGLTENGGHAVSCAWKPKWNQLPANERVKMKARQGVKTIAMTEVDIVDALGKSVKWDGRSMGEIVIRGASVMLGYLKNPEETSKCMKNNGWLYTGDVGVMNPDGYLQIMDRLKDVIISGGENVSSIEVESVLYLHPLVNEAAVVARPDEFWGETPCAFVSLKVNSSVLSDQEVIEFCRAQMPHYMAPKTVIFKEELPKTSTGKIKKFELREMAKSWGRSC